MNHGKSALLCLALLGASGCETLLDKSYHPLNGTTWRLTDVETSGTSTRLNPDLQARHTITFEKGGDLRMRLDCNLGNGQWSAGIPQANASSTQTFSAPISISLPAVTRAFCPRPTFGEDLSSDLPTALNFAFSNDGSVLSIRTREVTYLFVRY